VKAWPLFPWKVAYDPFLPFLEHEGRLCIPADRLVRVQGTDLNRRGSVCAAFFDDVFKTLSGLLQAVQTVAPFLEMGFRRLCFVATSFAWFL